MRLMVIGSLSGQISQASKIAIKKGAKVIHAEDTEQALGALRSGRGADIIMIDVKLDIASMIQSLETERFSVPVVACGTETDASAAVKAIKSGAKEYVPLPPDADLIAAVLQAVTADNTDMIAGDISMKSVISMADKVAPSNATILITGESGTGKEVMSKYVHNKSKRSTGPFISINCAAVPENLIESELFGYEKGAFTGATSRRIGKFEEANGGTLLLDEISEMDLGLQAKLLRAIQEKTIDRIGGKEPIKVDIRLIATSNRKLEEYVREGNFREDLYFRLNVINLKLPPLRERPSDIMPLAQMFADKYSEQNGIDRKKISEKSEKILKTHNWQGNVRELENTMFRAILISQEQEIESDAIQLSGQENSHIATAEEKAAETAQAVVNSSSSNDTTENINASDFVGKTVAEVERELILNTLDHCLGNRTHAANILGISIRTLRNKLKDYKEQEIVNG